MIAAAQFVVIDRASADRVGFVSFYNANSQHGYGYLAVAATAASRASGYMMEAALIFLDYLFPTWQLRRIYVETLEFNVGNLAAKAGLADFKDWWRHSIADHTPWGDEESPAIVTEVETALERKLAGTIMRGGAKPAIRKLKPGATLTEARCSG